MKVEFRSSFVKDLKSIKDKALLNRVRDAIEGDERAKTATEVSNLKKLKGPANYFRIRLGNYRIGIVLERDRATFVRFLDRKDIYKYFP